MGYARQRGTLGRSRGRGCQRPSGGNAAAVEVDLHVTLATFGQKIPSMIFRRPRLGFFNFHHSGETWPSYPGPDPIAAMVRGGKTHLVLTIHAVTDVIDGGAFVARSHRVAIPEGVNAIGMHRITWPQMGLFIQRSVNGMLEAQAASWSKAA